MTGISSILFGLTYSTFTYVYHLHSALPPIILPFCSSPPVHCHQKSTSPWTSHYFDDTITLEVGFLRTKNSIEIFKKTARDAGWEIQESKCTNPNYETEHFGVVFKTKSHQLEIYQDRMRDIVIVLKQWLYKKVYTKRQLLSFIG